MTSFFRGSRIFFTATFTDLAGVPANPTSAIVSISYTDLVGERQLDPIDMTLAGNVGSASWDSAVAEACIVEWSVKGIGANAIVRDGNFYLTANDSNEP